MKPSDNYVRIIEWSEVDQCYIGSSPGLMMGGCHGRDPRQVFDELSEIIEEVVALYQQDGKPLPPATTGLIERLEGEAEAGKQAAE